MQRKMFGQEGCDHMRWAANIVVGLDIGVLCLMCKEDDSLDPVISSSVLVDNLNSFQNKFFNS